MSRYSLTLTFLLAVLSNIDRCDAYQPSLDSLVKTIESSLRTYTVSEIEGNRIQTESACSTAIRELSRAAVGFALAHDLELFSLQTLLRDKSANLPELERLENRLRVIIPGDDQKYLDALRVKLSVYRRMLASTSESLVTAKTELAVVKSLGVLESWTAGEQQQLRSSFESLHQVILDLQTLEALQTSLSIPNVQTYLQISTIKQLGNNKLKVPIHFSKCIDQTELNLTGEAHISLAPSFGVSENSIPLKMLVEGRGGFDVTAFRKPAKIFVDLHAVIQGEQPLVLHSQNIQRNTPNVQARLTSNVRDAQLEGHLNKIRLARNLLSRVVQKKLSEQDPAISKKLEQEIASRAEEEGYKLAFKINRLLTQSLWNRLESVEFAPNVRLSANQDQLTSYALYAFPDQLGALTGPPEIPKEIIGELAWRTHIHESAVNNTLGKLGGFNLDEATMRGVWQVQLKLTTPEWDMPVEASIPSKITFSKERPIEIQIRDHRLIVLLKMHSATLATQKEQLPPLEVQLTYALSNESDRFTIRRAPVTLTSTLSPKDADSWTKLLHRFFPESLQPIPKFRPSMWENYVSLSYLTAQEGWLTIGLKNLSKGSVSEPQQLKRGSLP